MASLAQRLKRLREMAVFVALNHKILSEFNGNLNRVKAFLFHHLTISELDYIRSGDIVKMGEV